MTAMQTLGEAVWSAAYVNKLPDASFLYIAPGGQKDDDGKTKPRALRYFPYKDANGKVDLPHLRNALARIPQSKLPEDVKSRVAAKARRLAKGAGIKVESLFLDDAQMIGPLFMPFLPVTVFEFNNGTLFPEPLSEEEESYIGNQLVSSLRKEVVTTTSFTKWDDDGREEASEYDTESDCEYEWTYSDGQVTRQRVKSRATHDTEMEYDYVEVEDDDEDGEEISLTDLLAMESVHAGMMIKKMRRKRGYSRESMAARLSFNLARLREIEDDGDPTEEELADLASALGVSKTRMKTLLGKLGEQAVQREGEIYIEVVEEDNQAQDSAQVQVGAGAPAAGGEEIAVTPENENEVEEKGQESGGATGSDHTEAIQSAAPGAQGMPAADSSTEEQGEQGEQEMAAATPGTGAAAAESYSPGETGNPDAIVFYESVRETNVREFGGKAKRVHYLAGTLLEEKQNPDGTIVFKVPMFKIGIPTANGNRYLREFAENLIKDIARLRERRLQGGGRSPLDIDIELPATAEVQDMLATHGPRVGNGNDILETAGEVIGGEIGAVDGDPTFFLLGETIPTQAGKDVTVLIRRKMLRGVSHVTVPTKFEENDLKGYDVKRGHMLGADFTKNPANAVQFPDRTKVEFEILKEERHADEPNPGLRE